MSIKDDRTYLSHIAEAIRKIESYLAQVSYEQFASNEMMIDAVVRELEIIGEASNHISDEFKERYHDVPWHKMWGMRNFIVHQYFDVNLRIVWDTCKANLPELKAAIHRMLAS